MGLNAEGRANVPRAPGRKQRRAPIDFVSEGCWPYAQLGTNQESDKLDLYTAIYAQALAAALTEIIGNQSHRAFANEIAMPARTLDYLLAGKTAPDIATLAQLEAALDVTLLPADRLTLLRRS